MHMHYRLVVKSYRYRLVVESFAYAHAIIQYPLVVKSYRGARAEMH